MHFSSAYLLVSHGSRDPRPEIALEHLAELVRQRLQARRQRQGQSLAIGREVWRQEPNWERIDSYSRPPLVGTAVLELAPLPLHQQIQQFAEQALSAGYETVYILPLFLLPGVHVTEDIPAEVAMAQQQLGNHILLKLGPYLGREAKLWQLWLDSVEWATAPPQSGKILLAHGSRRPESQQLVEAIAGQIGAVPAYWSVDPGLEAQVSELIQRGYRQIMILPYFLFEGGITDALRDRVDQLSQQFPYAQVQLAHPISATPKLADQIVHLLL
ncbi:sirohydrochlorin chelatase [Leptolyngbya sp. NK1-12]|uniref:Sirohydrochlorin chelatase n=1 Tax=Leptolyngbya sp. NK1-12 TaxID=2547451 RepID=A0AA97AKG4_9CYAN|nr:sirohydrochlorin chelatase [Leptolyngbya sp. NK1-12]WNZ26086.1 sirohydrochlorin chelatase [Leptolyngbya sp. NK1-12]